MITLGIVIKLEGSTRFYFGEMGWSEFLCNAMMFEDLEDVKAHNPGAFAEVTNGTGTFVVLQGSLT